MLSLLSLLGLGAKEREQPAGQRGEHVRAALVAGPLDPVGLVVGGLGPDELLEVQAPALPHELVHGGPDLRHPVLTGRDPHVPVVPGLLLTLADQIRIEVHLGLEHDRTQQPPQVGGVVRGEPGQDPALDLRRDLIGAPAGQAQQQLHGRHEHRALLEQRKGPAQHLHQAARVAQLRGGPGLPDPPRPRELQDHVVTTTSGLLPPLTQRVTRPHPTRISAGVVSIREPDLRQRRALQVRQGVGIGRSASGAGLSAHRTSRLVKGLMYRLQIRFVNQKSSIHRDFSISRDLLSLSVCRCAPAALRAHASGPATFSKAPSRCHVLWGFRKVGALGAATSLHRTRCAGRLGDRQDIGARLRGLEPPAAVTNHNPD